VILVISSFSVIITLQLPPEVMAQEPSEGAKVLVDDVIQALKSNDTTRAQVHLNILNQQLPTFVNSSTVQSIKVLLDDASSALKNNDVNNALLHLNLVKQQLTRNGNITPSPSTPVKQTTPSIAGPLVTKVQSNHPPTADNLTSSYQHL
jgi:hypothetical protein